MAAECQAVRTAVGINEIHNFGKYEVTGPQAEAWLELNRDYSVNWPNITRKGEAPGDADAFKDEPGKYEKYFSSNPGNTDQG